MFNGDFRVQGGDTLYPQNSYCLSCEKGPSAFDTPHRIVTSVLYDLPVGKGRTLNITSPVVDAIIGGWQIGGILTLQSGQAGNLTIGGVDNAGLAGGNEAALPAASPQPEPSPHF